MEDYNLREVRKESAEQILHDGGFYDTIHRPLPIIEFSAKTPTNVEKVIPLLAADILVHQKLKKVFF